MAGYGDDSGFDTWLAAQGYSLPSGAPANAVLRQLGAVYIDGTYGLRFPGYPTGGVSQEREWPRTDAEDRYGNAIGIAAIPTRVIEASYFAAYQESVSAGVLSIATSAATRVKREKVEGAVEVEYAVPEKSDTGAEAIPLFTTIEGMLAPLLTSAPPIPGILIV